MAVLLLLAALVVYMGKASCKWNDLDLTELSGQVIQCIYGRYELEYTPCKNELSCDGDGEYMVIQYDTGSNQCVVHTAEFDGGVTSPTRTANETSGFYEFEFVYTNGLAGAGCSNGRWTTLTFTCDPDAKPYDIDGVDCGERGQQDGVCQYYMNIRTHLACGLR